MAEETEQTVTYPSVLEDENTAIAPLAYRSLNLADVLRMSRGDLVELLTARDMLLAAAKHMQNLPEDTFPQYILIRVTK